MEIAIININKNYVGDKMDRRAKEAARAVIEKAKFLGNPVAYYDDEKKKAYLEYANGEKKYAQ